MIEKTSMVNGNKALCDSMFILEDKWGEACIKDPTDHVEKYRENAIEKLNNAVVGKNNRGSSS